VTVDAGSFRSRSRNTPFGGWKLRGAPVATIVGGRRIELPGRPEGAKVGSLGASPR